MAFSSIFDYGALRTEFENAGISAHFIPVIWKYVLQNPSCELDEVPSIPSSAYPLLCSKFRAMMSAISSTVDSMGRVTTKLLINLQSCRMHKHGWVGRGARVSKSFAS